LSSNLKAYLCWQLTGPTTLATVSPEANQMGKNIALFLIGMFILGTSATAQVKTVWDGVYTSTQAERGRAGFTANCSRCHAENESAMPDPRLRGDTFMERWREDTIDGLFDQMRLTMPPNRRIDAPRLSDAVFLDLLAYIFQGNNFPSGSEELTVGNLSGIQMVEKDGPRPVPNFSLVQVVGCLLPRSDMGWMLTNAPEPVRSRNSEELNPAELKVVENSKAGTQTFRLNDTYEVVAGFLPETHKGQKVAAKGFLVRQDDGATRVNVSWVQMIASSCPDNP
jgi:hypothetical protein